MIGKSPTGSYWWTASTVVNGVGWGELVTVAPLNVTPRIGMWTPTNRSRIPPLGRLGLDSNTKLTSPDGGCAISSLFIMPAITALWE